MAARFKYDVVRRWQDNPLLTLDDIPFPCSTVFNAACTKYDGQYILLLRVEDLTGRSVFALAKSRDGYRFEVEPEPVMQPYTRGGCFVEYEADGIEDPRITKIGEVYYIMYTAVSSYGPLLALAKTSDFRKFDRVALISEPENKDGVLFPDKISGRYARLDRPVAGGRANIWISYSDDLVRWGDSRCVMTTRGDSWDSSRIGAGAQPIRTEDGWLIIYHGVKDTAGGPIYRLGAAVLDYNNPEKVHCRSAIPILSPREYYERVGDVNNVVFTCGAVLEEDGQQLKIYYGASDTSICLGTANVDELMQFCLIS